MTRSATKLKGGLSNGKFLHMRNCFVAIERCCEADKMALLSRPSYRGRRKSMSMAAIKKKFTLRDRAISLHSRMINTSPMDLHIEDEFGLELNDQTEEGEPTGEMVQQDPIGTNAAGQGMDIVAEGELNSSNEQGIYALVFTVFNSLFMEKSLATINQLKIIHNLLF